jgi:hypothetical protein
MFHIMQVGYRQEQFAIVCDCDRIDRIMFDPAEPVSDDKIEIMADYLVHFHRITRRLAKDLIMQWISTAREQPNAPSPE